MAKYKDIPGQRLGALGYTAAPLRPLAQGFSVGRCGMTSSSLTSSQILRRGYGFVAVTILIWASFLVMSRLGGQYGLTAYDLAALRTGTAALLLSPWWLPRVFDPSRRRLQLSQALVFALAAGVAYPLLAYSGFYFAPATHGAVLMSGLLPFVTALLVWWLLREKPHSRRVLGLLCIAAGVLALGAGSVREALVGGVGRTLVGDALFVSACVAWGLFTALIRYWNVRAFDVMLGVVAMSALLYLPVYGFFLPKQVLAVPWREVLTQAFFQGVLVVCVAMFTYARATEYLGASRVAVMMSLVPATGTLLAVLILAETLTVAAAAGVVLVSAGALLGATAPSLPRSPAP